MEIQEKFEQSSTFPPEIISEILLNLPYSDVLSYTLTCKGAIQDEYFWKRKVDRDFQNVSQYKPDELTYDQQYKDLIRIRWPDEASVLGRLDVLVYLKSQGSYPSQLGANYAAKKGHLHILKWMDQCGYPHPNQLGANYAAEEGHLNVIEWMVEKGYPSPDQEGVNSAAENGHLLLLKRLSLRPDQVGANDAVENGHLDILEWMGYPHPNQLGANDAAWNGHLHVLKWMSEKGYPVPDQDGINWAARNGHLDILKWAEQKGKELGISLLPSNTGAAWAEEHEHYEVADWLAERGIYSSF